VIEEAKRRNVKAICFVTGVPGSGKTLLGLNIATERMRTSTEEQAVFLSGNGPLVAVLREALAIDEVDRSKAKGTVVSKKDAYRHATAFIQNIHHFRDEYVRNTAAPRERVVVFDEAQRAWCTANLFGALTNLSASPTGLPFAWDAMPQWRARAR
jgi:ERCC4-related helicase